MFSFGQISLKRYLFSHVENFSMSLGQWYQNQQGGPESGAVGMVGVGGNGENWAAETFEDVGCRWKSFSWRGISRFW